MEDLRLAFAIARYLCPLLGLIIFLVWAMIELLRKE